MSVTCGKRLPEPWTGRRFVNQHRYCKKLTTHESGLCALHRPRPVPVTREWCPECGAVDDHRHPDPEHGGRCVEHCPACSLPTGDEEASE